LHRTSHASLHPIPNKEEINVSEGNLPRRLAISKKDVLHRTNKYIKERERKTVSRYITKLQLNWEEERLHARSFAFPGWNILESSISYLHDQTQNFNLN
jgi:hypothetical protein